MSTSKMRRIVFLVTLALLFAVPAAASPDGAEVEEGAVFRNPVAPTGADPWVIHREGMYYYCYSSRDGISVNQSPDLLKAVRREGEAIWTAPSGKAWSKQIWAPELHFLQGKWYVYFAADDGQNKNHRMYVLESLSRDALGAYRFVGKIAAPSDKWAIDGTVLAHRGALYFIWSGWRGETNVRQDLYIAPMKSPTAISGKRVRISTPDRAWEKFGRPLVNEGPEILKRNGAVFLIYSASGSWTDHYCLGQLKLVGDDPMDPESWEKKPTPVFQGTEDVVSPGHASFVQSPGGSGDWIVYHAAQHRGAGWKRNIRMQPFGWDRQGNPDFGRPVAEGVEIPQPNAE